MGALIDMENERRGRERVTDWVMFSFFYRRPADTELLVLLLVTMLNALPAPNQCN